MSQVVFWLIHTSAGTHSGFKRFDDDQSLEALSFMGQVRADPATSHVGIVSEPDGMVGAKDVGGSVDGGLLPNGEKYEWRKRR